MPFRPAAPHRTPIGLAAAALVLGIGWAGPLGAQPAATPAASAAVSPETAEIQRLIKDGQHTQALKLIDDSLAKNPKDAQMRFRRGVVLSMLDRKSEALAVFQKLVEDHPELPGPYNNLAVLYGAQGDYEKARQTLEKAIHTNPAYATAYQNLGDVYAQLASQAYSKALQVDGKTEASVQPKLALLRELIAGPNTAPTAAAAAKPAAKPPAATPTTVAANKPPAPPPAIAPPPPSPPPAPVAVATPKPAPAPAPASADTGADQCQCVDQAGLGASLRAGRPARRRPGGGGQAGGSPSACRSRRAEWHGRGRGRRARLGCCLVQARHGRLLRSLHARVQRPGRFAQGLGTGPARPHRHAQADQGRPAGPACQRQRRPGHRQVQAGLRVGRLVGHQSQDAATRSLHQRPMGDQAGSRGQLSLGPTPTHAPLARGDAAPMTPDTSTPSRKRRGAVLVGTLGLLCAGLLSATDSRGLGWWSSASAAQRPSLASNALRLADDAVSLPVRDPAPALQGSAESRLIAIYRLVGERRLDDALAASSALVQSQPNFRLAQLLHADLLAAHAAPLPAWGGSTTAAGLAPLRDEALQRLAALRERPPAGTVPAEFVQLPASVPYAIAVDASRNRLYLFENGGQGPRLAGDFYVSVGKQGVDKLAEGDQKTPLGIYYTTARPDPHAPQDRRLGAGVLPLNYPNAYDKTRGRTGKAILLHGVPADTYSRPPQDSDGCVVLANDDLLHLAALLPERDTPVLISRHIDWRAPQATQATLAPEFKRAFERWTAERLASPQAPAAITDTSLVAWKDDRELMVVTFREAAGPGQKYERVMRQYWGREGNDWRIVAEGQVH